MFARFMSMIGISLITFMLFFNVQARGNDAMPFDGPGFNNSGGLAIFAQVGGVLGKANEKQMLAALKSDVQELQLGEVIQIVAYATGYLETMHSGEAGNLCKALVTSEASASASLQGGMQIINKVMEAFSKEGNGGELGVAFLATMFVPQFEKQGQEDALATAVRVGCDNRAVANAVDGMGAVLAMW